MVAEWIGSSVFNEFAALLVLAAAIGFAGALLRQPLIVSFIAVGVLAGPSGLDIVRSAEPIDLLAELGIAVLLFLVGIKLDVKLVRSVGPVALATGLGQVAFTALCGFMICLALGLDAHTSIFVAVALAFSSTIIVVKLLSDKREIESLHGRIALGTLIVQDLVVVVAMIALAAIGIGARDGSGTSEIVRVLGAGFLMLALVVAFIRYLADPLTERLARAPELLIGFSIALAAAFAALGDVFGFGKELGGLLAGVALASTPFRDAIAARLAPLRDFLLLFFFIALGASLNLENLGRSGFEAIALSLFVLIGKPVFVLGIITALGYKHRTGFIAGLTLAQISEFSLIFMAMGVSLNYVSNEAMGLVTLVGLITIAASTYMITYSHQLYRLCEPLLRPFDKLATRRPGAIDDAALGAETFEIILFGLGRYGGTIGRSLIREGRSVLGVDFSPEAVRRWRRDDLPALFGDASDPEFLSGLPLRSATTAVLAVPDAEIGINGHDMRVVLIQSLKEAGFAGRLAVSTQRPGQRDQLLAAGADLVLEPYYDAADRAVELLLSRKVDERAAPEVEDQRSL